MGSPAQPVFKSNGSEKAAGPKQETAKLMFQTWPFVQAIIAFGITTLATYITAIAALASVALYGGTLQARPLGIALYGPPPWQSQPALLMRPPSPMSAQAIGLVYHQHIGAPSCPCTIEYLQLSTCTSSRVRIASGCAGVNTSAAGCGIRAVDAVRVAAGLPGSRSQVVIHRQAGAARGLLHV